MWRDRHLLSLLPLQAERPQAGVGCVDRKGFFPPRFGLSSSFLAQIKLILLLFNITNGKVLGVLGYRSQNRISR